MPHPSCSRILLFLLLGLLLAACRPGEDRPAMVVMLVADGRERALTENVAVTVAELLRREEIELGDLDEVNPPQYSQIANGMRITVARVREETQCEDVDIAFRSRTIPNEALAPGETRLGQPGITGVEQVCYRVTIRDGVRQEPVPVSRVPVSEPQDEIIFVGPSGELDAVPINGTLAYLSSGNIWLMRGSSETKRPLTDTNDVDGRVFAISPDGLRILFTRRTPNESETGIFNQLWMFPDTSRDIDAITLMPENVLSASWVPGQENTVSYSTGEVSDVAPGWRSNNDLFLMTINPESGTTRSVNPLIAANSFGLYNWWGTGYHWSPAGDQLAWVRADSMGLVNLGNGEFITLLDYPVFETRQSWSWRATVSFSPDESLIVTTVHGDPIGNEPPETSPAFHVAVTDAQGRFAAEVQRNTGIWSMPVYSPLITNEATGAQVGYIAYLRARDLSNSINQSAQYDLMIADRDGSNERLLFPQPGNEALRPDANPVWSPDGRQIAFIYQGNLWLVDAASGNANQLTLDGNATQPVWTR
jgi:resuscitation-promoting factor RpfB